MSKSEIYFDPMFSVGEGGEDWHYEIFPDADAGMWVELRYIEHGKLENPVNIHNMIFSPELARSVATALIKMADHLEQKAKLT